MLAMNRTNYVFVDYENVQEIDLDRIAGKPVKVTLVLGEGQKTLPIALVKKVRQFASQISLVETGRSGRNALDLVLAYHIGLTKQFDPEGSFYIISGDKGFDALIDHLKLNGTPAARRGSFHEVIVSMCTIDPKNRLVDHFRGKTTGLPKKRRSLEAYIRTYLGGDVTLEQLENSVQVLVAEKIVTFSKEDDVTYCF